MFKLSSVFLVVLFFSCTQKPAENTSDEKERTLIFPQGNKNTNDNFIGEVWVQSLIDADSLNQSAVGNVTFAPGARSKWHMHPGGQILLVTDGVGYYQEKDQPKLILRKGDVIKCPPNVAHWHGASADASFVQIAITDRASGPTVWLGAVSNEDYHSGPND